MQPPHQQIKYTLEGIMILGEFYRCGGNAIAFAKLDQSCHPLSLAVFFYVDLANIKMEAQNAALHNILPTHIGFFRCDSIHSMVNCYFVVNMVLLKQYAIHIPSTLFEWCSGFLVLGV